MAENSKDGFKPDRKRENYIPLDMTCLSLGYFSDKEKQKLRENLIGTEAEKLAKIFARLELTTTQLRKFFNEVRSLEGRMEDDNFQLAPIRFLKSKAAMSAAKQTSKTPKQFKDFIDACVDKINDDRDFYGFARFFESIVGYFYYFKEEYKSNSKQ